MDVDPNLVRVELSPIMMQIFNRCDFVSFLPKDFLDPFDCSWVRLELCGLFSVCTFIKSLRLMGKKIATLSSLVPGGKMPIDLQNKFFILPEIESIDTLFKHINKNTPFILGKVPFGLHGDLFKDLTSGGAFLCGKDQPDFDAAVIFPSGTIEGVYYPSFVLLQQDKSKQLVNLTNGCLTANTMPLSDIRSASLNCLLDFGMFPGIDQAAVQWICNKPLKNKKINFY